MKLPRSLRWAIPTVLILGGLAACNENDVTGAGGALASLTIDAPESAVSGQAFSLQVNALAIGLTNVRNGRVEITLPAPLQVSGTDPSAGTTATFANTVGGGAQVTWTLNTLDANTQSSIEITSAGALVAGGPNRMLTVEASLTADNIAPGESVAQDSLELRPQ